MATSTIKDIGHVENISSLVTAKNGATITSAIRTGHVAEITILLPTGCADGTIVASVDDSIKRKSDYAIGMAAKSDALTGYAILGSTKNIVYHTTTPTNEVVQTRIVYIC